MAQRELKHTWAPARGVSAVIRQATQARPGRRSAASAVLWSARLAVP